MSSPTASSSLLGLQGASPSSAASLPRNRNASAPTTTTTNTTNSTTNTTTNTTINSRRNTIGKISSRSFYGEYHGHKVRHLEPLLQAFRQQQDNLASSATSAASAPPTTPAIIWTAGDSSLDNKYWFRSHRPAVEGPYQQVLDPPTSNADVTYWLNYLIQERRKQQQQQQQQNDTQVGNYSGGNHSSFNVMGAINTAVEATTLNERTRQLRPQDIFMRDNIQSNDVLIVSIGGNDVALTPTPCTIASILGLVCCLPKACTENGTSCCASWCPSFCPSWCRTGSIPINDCCCGCGTSLCSCFCAAPPCLGYLNHLFGYRMQHYLQQITSKTRPKQILVCMIYFPDENNNAQSWAGPTLSALGYNSDPTKLQALIRKAFVEATSRIRIEGTEVVPVPLFVVLDGKTSEDYVARVEPSPQGGRKMAEFLLHRIESVMSRGTNSAHENCNHFSYSSFGDSAAAPSSLGAAPATSRMSDR